MLKINGKIQPHCGPCGKPFWEDDLVQTDNMFEQIQHVECFTFKREYIKETGSFGDIVRKHPNYNKTFLILQRSLTLH